MRTWSDTHPKAKLLARKRAAILLAARDVFFREGYDGASMEAIAAAADVSIMTLYRHAESKDRLFAAVMLSACELAQAEDGAGSVAMAEPLREVMIQVGDQFQEKLASPETVSLFRTVMVETTRFPDLARAAYDGLIRSWETKLDEFLSERTELSGVAAGPRRAMIGLFLDDLVGADALRALLGLGGPSAEERTVRSALATERLLAKL